MKINEIPRGQLSTIILSSLLDGDKYGYEIIASVEERTNGEVIIKKPSLYSSLNRMEKQDLVSSYWRDSELGGRRHYYRLTDYGKKQVLQWQTQLNSSQSKLSQILQNKQKENQAQDTEKDGTAMFLQQESLFNLTDKQQEKVQTETGKIEEKQEQTQHDYIQFDLFSQNSFIQTPDLDEEEIFVSKTENTKTDSDHTERQMPDVEDDIKNQTNLQDETTNSLIKLKPSSEISNSFKQNIAELLKNENTNFDEKLLKAKQSFNFESEYNKHLKTAKSYAETFTTKQSNVGESTSSPYFEEDKQLFSNPEDNQVDLPEVDYIKKVTPSFYEEKQKFDSIESNENDAFVSNTTNHSFLNNINQTEKENQIVEHDKQEPAKSIFIQERMENPPKVQKIQPVSFAHLNKNAIPTRKNNKNEDNLTQNISTSSQTSGDNVIDLEGKSNFKKQLTEEEKYFNSFGISLSNYSRKLNKPQKDIEVKTSKEFLKINKFNFFSSLSILMLLILQVGLLFLMFNNLGVLSTSGFWLYGTLTFSCLIWTAYNLSVYIKDRNYKIKKQSLQLTSIWQKSIFIIIFLVLVYSIHILAGMTIFNYLDYLPTLLLSVIVCLNVITYHFIQLFNFK